MLRLKTAGTFLLFLFYLCFPLLKTMAQSPVLVTASITPPYSTLLSEYYSGDGQRVTINLLNTDPNQPFLQGHLRVTIEGQGVNLQSSAFGNYPVLDLMHGAPLMLNGTDLAPYFSPQNLSGTTGQGFKQQNRLPEGFYQFCFEVLEKNTNRVIGAKQCAQVYLQLNDPPYLLLPEKTKAIAYSNPFNLLFQWNPRHINIANTEYQFDLVEIWDEGIAPEAAFYTAKPIYSTTVYSSNLFYGPAEPQLLVGKQYAWRVKAKVSTSTNELEPFKNDGYSEIFWFKLQGECATLQKASIVSDPVTNKTTLSWIPDVTNIGSTELEYRTKGSNKWITVESTNHQATLTGLAWNTDYEYKLGNRCVITDDYAFGALQSFKTLSQDTANCVPSAPLPLSNQQPIAMLRRGDTIYASGFQMRLTQVSGSGGQFSGQGYLALIIPTTTTEVSVKATFSNIGINTDKQVISGNIISLYDKTEKGIGNLDPVLEGGIDVGDVKTGGTSIDTKVDVPIDPNVNAGVTVTGTIPDTTYTVTLTSVDGKPVVLTTKKIPIVVQDSKGDIYSIDKTGKVTPIGKASAALLAGKTTDVLDKLNSDKGKLVFEAHTEQVYAFDPYQQDYNKSMLFSQQYESLNNGEYRVANKLLITNSSDKITAKLSNLKSGLNEDSIHFITGKGVELLAKKIANKTYEITLLSGPAGDAQELYAIYRDNEGFKANTNASLKTNDFTYSLGKLKIATYEPKNFTVKVVPVGDAQVNAEKIAKNLNDAYNKIGVRWTVIPMPGIGYDEWDNGDKALDIKDAGKSNKYSEEMQKLNAYYIAKKGVDEKTPYLFVFDKAPVNGQSNVEGDMLRNRQFGYLFPSVKDKLAPHELAHGMFHLEHTFEDKYKFSKSDLPDNLMSYGDGMLLAKLQWDAIHAPGIVFGIFESEGDAAFHEGKFVCIDNKLKQLLVGKQNYYAPNGKKINIGTAIPISFYKGDSKALDGSLHAYERGGTKYISSTLKDEFDSYRSDKNVADPLQYISSGDAVKIIFDTGNNYTFEGQSYYNSGCDLLYQNCKTKSSQDFKKNNINSYKVNQSIADKIDEITELIDEDADLFEEMMLIIESAKKINPSDSDRKKYCYFNKDYIISSYADNDLQGYENFKQSIISYKAQKTKIIELANAISCEPASGESNQAFKGRVYFCSALLTPNQAASLSLDTRKNLLCALSKFSLMGLNTVDRDQLTSSEGKEEVVLRLIRTTPTNDRKAILDALSLPYSGNTSSSPLINLIHGLDGNNYSDFMLMLTDWIVVQYPNTQSWQEILQRNKREERNILALGDALDGYDLNLGTDLKKSIVSFEVTVNPSLQHTSHELNNVNLYDYIVIKFTGDYSFGGKNYQSGVVYVLPALYVYAIMHEMKVNTWVTTGKYTLYVAFAAIGVSQIRAAQTAFEMTIALADMSIATNDIIVNEVLANQLNQTADGRQFLDLWNKFVLLYGGTRIITDLTGLSKELNALAKKINKSETNKIAEEINKKVGLIDDVTTKIFKNVNFEDFIATVDDFKNGANKELAEQAYKLWGEDKWDELHSLFNPTNGPKLNNGWPPYNGVKIITKTETGNQLIGKVFDRFQLDENLGGNFASPVLNSSDDVGELVFTYDSRALANQIQDGNYYIKFKFKDNLPSDLKFEYGEAIPWFNLPGLADQAKSNYSLGKLYADGKIEVLEVKRFYKADKSWR